MCGICGYFQLKRETRSVSEDDLRLMCRQMVSRGPDGEGIWQNESKKIGLGHRRLSIIDLSENATQPMTNEDGKVVLAFNGEIYNHAELRLRLEKESNHKWKTDHSDTEVIIHAYEEWGIKCIDEFRGCFAFALWDERKEILFLVRDRLGIKPLYYCIDAGTLFFASEIKALLPVIKRCPKMNERAIFDYLTFLCVPGKETLFDGIYKVCPANYLMFDSKGRYNVSKYWDVWNHILPEIRCASDAEIHSTIRKELDIAVQYRKVSDVPVGVFLSGGVDSSTNCYLFSKNHSTEMNAFCIGYSDAASDYRNENHYAKQVADECNAIFHERYLSESDWLSFIPEMIRLQDEPIADPTCVPSYYVSKLARENGIKVAQVGEGSDELFIGYDLWLKFHWAQELDRKCIWNTPKKLGYGVVSHSKRYGATIYTEILRRASKGEPLFYSGAEFFYHNDKKEILSNRMKDMIGERDSFEAIRNIYERFIDTAWEKSDLNWMSYADMNVRLPELLLMRVDKMSMGVSLECRVPFLDHRVVELAMSIPGSRKIEGNITKRMLKESVRGMVPNDIIDRRKQGFGIPIHSWINKKLGSHMRESVFTFANSTSLFDYTVLKDKMESFNANQIWCLYNLSEWWKTYIN